MSKSSERTQRILAFGAHPDDIEFGCGALLIEAAGRGAEITLVVCSKGEAGTNGTAIERTREAKAAAKQLGAQLRFVNLGGDGQMWASPEHAQTLAYEIRRSHPQIVLAPTVETNQHPDHVVVGTLARDAARLARFGGLEALSELPPHAVANLLFYAIGPSAEPPGRNGLWFDVSAHLEAWEKLMSCHASQMKTRRYLDLQLGRARTRGFEAGVEAVQVLYPNEPLRFDGLASLPAGIRHF